MHDIAPAYLQNQSEGSTSAKNANQFKAVKTLAIVLGVFLLTYLPAAVYGLIIPNYDQRAGKELRVPKFTFLMKTFY